LADRLFFLSFGFMRTNFFILLFFTLFEMVPAFSGKGQESKDNLILAGATQISLTRQGQLLVATDKSSLFLLDSLGKVQYQFSPRRPARVHLLEGWNGLRLFAFYRDFQEFIFLDRFLLADGTLELDPEKTGYARLVAPSQDGNLWVLDESSFQLKKMNPQSQKTIFSTPLDLVLSGTQYELSFMREYQNLLFVADRQGKVLLFDQMGNFKKKLPLENCEWLAFQGDEVYGVEKDSLAFFHPLLLKKRKYPLPPEAIGASRFLLSGSQIFWILKDGLHRKEIPVWLKEQ